MQQILLISSLMLLFLIPLSAQENQNTLELEGKKYTMHRVVPGETLFSISKKYQLSVEAIKAANKLEGNSIDLDRILIIPLDAVVEKEDKTAIQKTSTSFYTHKVESGETLYSIARKYDNVSPSQIKVMNDLKSDTLKVGMLLEIPQELKEIQKETEEVLPASENKPVKQDSANIIDKRALFSSKSDSSEVAEIDSMMTENDSLSEPSFWDQFDTKTLNSYRKKFEQIDTLTNTYEVERGIGTWLETFSDDDKSYFFALHNTAKQGSILKVRNLMNNRTVYVKVIGKLPKVGSKKNIIIKISQSAAQFLNILDEKFLVEIIQIKEK